MEFSTLVALGLPVLGVAQTDASSGDPVTNFVRVANQTMVKLNFLGCSVRRLLCYHGRMIESLNSIRFSMPSGSHPCLGHLLCCSLSRGAW